MEYGRIWSTLRFDVIYQCYVCQEIYLQINHAAFCINIYIIRDTIIMFVINASL